MKTNQNKLFNLSFDKVLVVEKLFKVAMIKDVFRSLPNIYDGAFAGNYFCRNCLIIEIWQGLKYASDTL